MSTPFLVEYTHPDSSGFKVLQSGWDYKYARDSDGRAGLVGLKGVEGAANPCKLFEMMIIA